MNNPYTFIPDLTAEVQPPKDGILSRTLHNDAHAKIVLFGFGAGQELSEHTSSLPAIIQIVKGEAELTLGNDVVQAKTGALIYMPPQLRHRVLAKTDVVMLLVLNKGIVTDKQTNPSA